MLNYSEACERNKVPIFNALQALLVDRNVCSILEVGSGSGQHAIHFTRQQPQWRWQTTELADNIAALRQNISSYNPQLPQPLILDVNEPTLSKLDAYDVLFTANTLHIMSAESVEQFFQRVSELVLPEGFLAIYGPFKYGGEFTSESNAEFDRWLKARNPASGIRDFEWIGALAKQAGLELFHDQLMPANNQLVSWQRIC